MSYFVSSLHRFPIKSFKGIEHSSLPINSFGFVGDRRYMLVDKDGKFVTQRKHPKLALLTLSESDDAFTFGAKDKAIDLVVPKSVCTRPETVVIWGDQVRALVSDYAELDTLSDYIGQELRLAFMPDDSFRQVDREFFDENKRVGFADAFPFLLISESSLDDLNSRLDLPVPMSRFRPNIVISGTTAYQEDSWKKIKIGSVEFAVVKPCSRCIMTTVDDQGETSKEPLKTLAKYRTNAYGACFGQNLVHLSEGKISVGDELEVIE